MLKLFIRWIIIAVALVVAAWLIPGITISDTNGWIAVGVMAAVLGLAGNLALWFFVGIPANNPSVSPRVADVMRLLDLREHLDSFLSGALDTGDVFYCLSVTVCLLFVTTRVLESRRWRV